MTTPHRGYAAAIAEAIGLTDPDTLALIENLMRQETGGSFDHLSPAEFSRHARQAHTDARAWDTIGDVNGYTLADYCRAVGIQPPTWLGTP